MRFLAAACLAWLLIVLVQAPDAMAQEAKPAAKTKTGAFVALFELQALFAVVA